MAKILIAEDDVSMQHFLCKALSQAGHEVEARSDGVEAFKVLTMDGARYDLLLTDIVMPGMDGMELAHRASTHDAAIKIMFITGFAATVANDTGGPDRPIMQKPFHLNALVSQVNALLASDKNA